MSAPAPRRLNVFVSSVYQELKDLRAAAIDAIWRCDCFPIGMDRLDVALPYSPGDSSRKMVEEADIYIGLFSQRYGVITAQEYAWAVELGKPILIFDSDMPLNAMDRETNGDHVALLAALKQEFRERYVVASFHSAEELSKKLFESLTLWQHEHLQPAATPAEPAKPTRTRAIAADIPQPPKPYYAHPYFLGMQFFGRHAELAQLDAWATAPEPLLIIDAIGGAGKSALTWHWTRDQTHAPKVFPNTDGTLWWSFYEADATMPQFLAKLLAYLTEQEVETFEGQPRHKLEEQALTLLNERRVLLVFDGLERLLLAYRRLDAAQIADEAVDQDRTLRSCSDPRDGAFLRRLTLCERSKILISSRLIPQELQDRMSQQLLPGVRSVHLYGMTPEDALAMFEGLGAHGNHEVMRTLLGQFGDHALLIGVLAGRIRAYRPAPGNFDAWYADQGRDLHLEAQDLTQRRTSILAAALADLDPTLFDFLGQLAAFRYPVEYEVLLAINPFLPASEGEPDQEARLVGVQRLNEALAELEARGLVQWERATNLYDLHPVVRAYAYDHLADRAVAYARIRGYFEALPAEDTQTVQDVSQLRRTMEIYYALLRSGQVEAAFTLYGDRLTRTLLYNLGAYQTMVECLLPLFPQGIEQLPDLSRQSDQSFVINDLALAFDVLGDPAAALKLFAQAVPLNLATKDVRNLTAVLISLSFVANNFGELACAVPSAELSLAVARANKEQDYVDEAHHHLINYHTLRGDFQRAEVAYQALLASPDDHVKRLAFTAIYAAQLCFFQGGDLAPDLQEAMQRARQERFPFALRETYRLQGEVAFAGQDFSVAETAWLAALELAQQSGIPLAPFHANLARVRAQQGRAPEARALIEQALVEGAPHLEAAEVYLALGERELAREHILPAYRRAWADGPPYTYVYDLKRARAVLSALGMAEPTLPAYDPAKVRPIPQEVAIRAFIAELEQKNPRKPPQDNAPADATVQKPRRRLWPFGR